MTLDTDSWSAYFDEINVFAERLKATVTLARVPLSPVRAGRTRAIDAKGGLLDSIRYNRSLDEIEIAIRRNGAADASLRYFIPAPRSVSVEDRTLSKLICITDRAGLRTMLSLVSYEPEFEAIGHAHAG
jgi:hypothetical protein